MSAASPRKGRHSAHVRLAGRTKLLKALQVQRQNGGRLCNQQLLPGLSFHALDLVLLALCSLVVRLCVVVCAVRDVVSPERDSVTARDLGPTGASAALLCADLRWRTPRS